MRFSVYRNGVKLTEGLTGDNGYTAVLTSPFSVTLNRVLETAEETIVVVADVSTTVS